MIKLILKHSSGFEISYEGPEEGLERVLSLVSGDLRATLEDVQKAAGKPSGVPRPPSAEGEEAQDENGEATPLDAAAIAARLDEVEAKTDIERVTVIAQAAVDAKRAGLDYDTVDQLYLQMGLKRPPKWRPTFSNARTRGYLQNAGRGLWKPTVLGSNFALLGQRAPARRRAPRSARGGDED